MERGRPYDCRITRGAPGRFVLSRSTTGRCPGGFSSMAVSKVMKKASGSHSRQSSVREPKYVYSFANGKAEGSSLMRPLLGGKGSELAEMTNLGIPVPPGFTITTAAWAAYEKAGKKHPPGL